MLAVSLPATATLAQQSAPPPGQFMGDWQGGMDARGWQHYYGIRERLVVRCGEQRRCGLLSFGGDQPRTGVAESTRGRLLRERAGRCQNRGQG